MVNSPTTPEPEDDTMPVFLNPLRWPEGDALLSKVLGREATPENLLEYLQGPYARASLTQLRKRYDDLTRVDGIIIAVPNHPAIVWGILIPLTNAKGACVLGHYVSCIALCGAVAEALALFRFRIAPADQRAVLGVSDEDFARAHQVERAKQLLRAGLINDDTKKLFDTVRTLRRPYLHLLGVDYSNLSRDAASSYEATVQLVVRIFGIGVQGRRLTFHPEVIAAMRMS